MNDSLFIPVSEEFDQLTQHALEMLMNALLIILERQAMDQLHGGIYMYYEPNLEQQSTAADVPTKNVVSERDFAILDMLVQQKLLANIASYEAIILLMNNKTRKWLWGKSERGNIF